MKTALNTFALALLAVVCATGAGAENGATLSVESAEPPADLAQEVLDVLAPTRYTLSEGGKPFYEFWLAKELKASAKGEDTRETLLNVEPVSVVGALVVHEPEHYDFRDDPVDPGVYVMRMALQPKDGNHLGTAPYDTFAILIPVEKDGEVREFFDHEIMVEIASEDTVAAHPPILSLQPLEDVEGEFPRMHWDEEEEWRFVYLNIPTNAGGETIELKVGLVIEGMGEI